MPPTLASLVHHSALKLTVRAGEDRLDTPVRWAHVSELPDPVPYMEGGELLLVTAMKLEAEDPEAMRRYVRRLAGAGVVGLGFAVGVHYEDIPQALVDAATEQGLPLLEVPRRTPFLAISKAVSAANAADQYRAVTAGFEAQRELTKAALSGDGPGDLLARLASHVNGWAALYDVSGAVVAAAPDWAARRAARLTADVERLRERPAPASSVVGGGGADSDAEADDRVELQSLGAGRRVRGVLAVGTGAPLGTAERYAVHSAIALLTLTTERSRSLQAAEQRLGAAVLRMLLAGEPDHARAVAGDLYGALLDAPFRLLIAEPAAAEAEGAPAGADPLHALADAMESAAMRAGEPVLVVPDGDRLVVLAADGGDAVAACLAHTEARRGDSARPHEPAGQDELVVGLSAPAGPIAAVGAYKQAEQALSVARRRGRALVEHEELAAGSVMQLLADDAVRSFADGTLRALHEHDAKGRGDLIASLRAWLSRHGQWDAAAADLGVHRHTLRYRMRRVEEILGRSLDDADVRMELWLALKATSGAGSA
ncbi:PucR family transcriptional regulator [Streptomyces agglomeratus]|uniref:PucR family transcriptional regulator n=1 Tax=Streptomyces agglomeratus TaxID=285458 RepID=A0A1E5P5G1_9ACTN|nr:PucR family transcriptional regulator [Streptomyces agglomeratus]OEJ24752.1 PucR family transcriptional regulator [Streptomyces agglomeratus]OEJ41280.1 PucR family transcriptional regulator [Streptomyces agglomeratus]OEJ44343.1 PucR family transcriptional regulator [Streptomyces agglomeratus]OEJ53779.1 PucR family transcriptional regulator [Streptomyces agglomeratus]OEJ61148.1 PucR family transcriptional regulator [Streptomyces agglomeratus]